MAGPVTSAMRRRRPATSIGPQPRRAAASARSVGIPIRASEARSHARRPGAAKSRSRIAIACPSRKTRFSRHRSLCAMTGSGPGTGSAISGDHGVPAVATNPTCASWNRRSSAAALASASSLWAHAGYGGCGTSPGMKRRRSRPSPSRPSGSGTPSNPAARRCRSSAWSVEVAGLAGRSTTSPRRTTAPAFATPPVSGCSSIRASVARRDALA